MARKKTTRKKKSSPALNKKAKKKLSAKKTSKLSSKPSARSKKLKRVKKSAVKRSRGSEPTSRPSEARINQGVGLSTGGQSGDTQGLSKRESADSESVEELVDEGQDYEAEVISGIQNALDPDQAEVTTREVPEDDVPPEYRNQEQ